MSTRSATHATFVIERDYAAAPARVFAAWADTNAKGQWFGPGGEQGHQLDFREGGREHFQAADGGTVYSYDALYEDIVPDERIVSTEVFEAMPEAEAHSTVVFRAAPDGHHTVLSILVRHASRENRDVHLRAGMEEGMNEAFDLLETVAGGSAVAR